MNKKDRHRQDLLPLFSGFFETGDPAALRRYLVSNSSLPGRRANLELAAAFGDLLEEGDPGRREGFWGLCVNLAGIPAGQAPVNSPEEFLPFCGAIGIGALGAAHPGFYDAAIQRLRGLANDPRWRMREAVCFGLQRLLASRGADTLGILAGWPSDGSLLELRAAAASVAEPGLLETPGFADSALQLHQAIFQRVLKSPDRRAEDFKVLRKALGYTLSVVACGAPEEGFGLMKKLIVSRDPDLLWIVRQNLKKNRLVKKFPRRVVEVQRLLTG